VNAVVPYTPMYQTARMLDIALSRSELAVCMTRFAIRPAKSFWKNGQLWRTTCQWLCQRIRLVAPGTSALCRIATSLKIASGRTTSTRAIIATSIGVSAASAAARSVVSISATSRPMKSGITVSSSATARLAANIAAYQPFVWRMKCQ
jgi:hypothetical protein